MALATLSVAGHIDYRLDLISLAVKSKEVSMNTFITMIDDMVALVKNVQDEQGDDDNKEMCKKQFDISDHEKEIDDSKQTIATLPAACGVMTKLIEPTPPFQQRRLRHSQPTRTTSLDCSSRCSRVSAP